jgi:hypothetical protein
MALVLDELERRLSARLAGTTGPVAAAGLVLIYALLPYVVRTECSVHRRCRGSFSFFVCGKDYYSCDSAAVFCLLPIDNCIRPDAVHDAVRWCILPALCRLRLTLPFACTRFDRSIPAAAASISSGPALDAVSVVKCTEALPLDAYFTLIQVRPPCLTVAVAQLGLGP